MRGFFRISIFRPSAFILPPSQISHQRPGHVKHQGSKGTLLSKIHIAHPKRREKHLLRILRSFGQDTIAECITRQRRMGTRQQKTSAIGGGLGVGLPRFELGMTGPESVVLPLHHSPMICSCRKDDAKVELNFLSAKKNRCFFTFSLSTAPKSTSDAPEHPPRRHTATPRHSVCGPPYNHPAGKDVVCDSCPDIQNSKTDHATSYRRNIVG